MIVNGGTTVICSHTDKRIHAQATIVITVFLQINGALVNNRITSAVGGHTNSGVINGDNTTLLVDCCGVLPRSTASICPNAHTNRISSGVVTNVVTQSCCIVYINPQCIQCNLPRVFCRTFIDGQHTDIATSEHLDFAAVLIEYITMSFGAKARHTVRCVIKD